MNARTGPGIYTFDGGDGIDTLVGAERGEPLVPHRRDAGSLNGTTSFRDVENLTGGTGADPFKVGAPAIRSAVRSTAVPASTRWSGPTRRTPGT